MANVVEISSERWKPKNARRRPSDQPGRVIQFPERKSEEQPSGLEQKSAAHPLAFANRTDRAPNLSVGWIHAICLFGGALLLRQVLPWLAERTSI